LLVCAWRERENALIAKVEVGTKKTAEINAERVIVARARVALIDWP
jgi:hypothetical protein